MTAEREYGAKVTMIHQGGSALVLYTALGYEEYEESSKDERE